MNCPLCHSTDTEQQIIAGGKSYSLCQNCKLIFLEEKSRLNATEEKKRYSYHQNNIDDEGYVKFLSQIINPVVKKIKANSRGLDYGCGPDPVLSKLVNNLGFACDFYDPYFWPELDKSKKFDFIFATECFEHFFSPSTELETINSILKSGGILAIMTEFWSDIDNFSNWYYIKDPTHVCFYHKESLDYIAHLLNLKIVYFDNKRVVLMQ
jgi:SAM-dependent methyltransferase